MLLREEESCDDLPIRVVVNGVVECCFNKDCDNSFALTSFAVSGAVDSMSVR